MTPNPSRLDPALSIASALAACEQPAWFRVGTLLDGIDIRPRHNVHLVYDPKGIRYVGDNPPPADLVSPGQSTPDLDLPDHTLLPGLIEAHAHLFLQGGESDPEKRNAYLKQSSSEHLANAKTRLEKLVRLGVLGVRDAGDKNGVGLALSKLYTSQSRPLMPYLDSPGAAIHHKGRYGSFMADALENHESPEECVASRVRLGADRIKLIPTGIINFQKGQVTSEPQMTSEEVTRLVKAAKHLADKPLPMPPGIKESIALWTGKWIPSSTDFLFAKINWRACVTNKLPGCPPSPPVQAQVDHTARMGWDDQVVSNLRRILEQHAISLVKAHEMGVQIIAGSDAGSYGVPHGLGFYYELELMQRAGLSPLSVINAATGNSSQRLGYKEKFGKIRQGYQSRFILTEFSPLESVTNLRKPKLVIYDGVVSESAAETSLVGLCRRLPSATRH